MSTSLIFALLALLAFGFVFRLVSLEERRSFFRVLVALLLVVGLVSYFVHPLTGEKKIKDILNLVAIVSFLLSVLFLLAYLKLDQKIRMEKGELHGPPKRKGGR